MKIYFCVALGVVISVILPLIRALLPKPPRALIAPDWWPAFRPYVLTGVFSLVVALLIVAAMGPQLNSWATALFAGYTWDSTMQKFTTGNASL